MSTLKTLEVECLKYFNMIEDCEFCHKYLECWEPDEKKED